MASRRALLLVMVALGGALLVASCGGAASTADGGEGDVTVVASFPLIGELAQAVAGDRAEVITLVPLGVDEHAFQPSTTVARRVAEADLALVNGFRLEEALLPVIVENVRAGVPVVAVARGLTPLAASDEHDEDGHDDEAAATPAAGVDDTVFAEGDPHFWLDARLVVRYVENIRDALSAVDAGGADGYRERAAALIASLEALDGELRDSLAAIPQERRRLVVFHDAFGYFAAAYDFEVIAAVAPANPNQEASAAAIAEIVATVRAAGVPTVFREPQYRAQALDLIAAETGTRVGVLHSIPSEELPTYAELMRANARALVEGLGR